VTPPSYWREDPSPVPELEIGFDELVGIAIESVPDREAMVFVPDADATPSRMTYAELGTAIDEVERALVASDIGHGGVVAVYGSNRPEFVLLQFACCRIGAIAVPVNPLYGEDELLYVLGRAGVQICFAEESHRGLPLLERLEAVAGRLDSLRRCVTLDGPPWEDWMAHAGRTADDAVTAARARAGPRDVAEIQFTSGTTGRPKAVQITSQAMANAGRCVAHRAELEDGCRYVHAMPFFHVGGTITAMASLLAARGTHVFLPTFSPRAMCAAIERERATAALAVPTMMISLLHQAESQGARFEHLRVMMTGGALVPEAVASAWIERYGVGISNTYGMTELSGPNVQTAPSDPLARALQTCGRPLPGIEVDVVQPGTERRVPMGQEGEIRFRGWGVMPGYLADPDATAAVISEDGWLRSGDIGVLGEDGFVAVTGRAKDIIIRGGENIAPVTIEDAIRAEVPDVVDVSVIGVPDDYYGEAVAAYVILRESATMSLESLQSRLEGRLPHTHIPAHLRVVDAFPTTPSGKVQKFRLVEMFNVESG
jgi:fatty-acyl-CoA synthase